MVHLPLTSLDKAAGGGQQQAGNSKTKIAELELYVHREVDEQHKNNMIDSHRASWLASPVVFLFCSKKGGSRFESITSLFSVVRYALLLMSELQMIPDPMSLCPLASTV